MGVLKGNLLNKYYPGLLLCIYCRKINKTTKTVECFLAVVKKMSAKNLDS